MKTQPMLIAIVGVVLLAPQLFAQPTITTLAEIDGQIYGGLLIGPNGAIYGPTVYGGSYGKGSVFELSPPTGRSGAWSLTNAA